MEDSDSRQTQTVLGRCETEGGTVAVIDLTDTGGQRHRWGEDRQTDGNKETDSCTGDIH